MCVSELSQDGDHGQEGHGITHKKKHKHIFWHRPSVCAGVLDVHHQHVRSACGAFTTQVTQKSGHNQPKCSSGCSCTAKSSVHFPVLSRNLTHPSQPILRNRRDPHNRVHRVCGKLVARFTARGQVKLPRILASHTRKKHSTRSSVPVTQTIQNYHQGVRVAQVHVPPHLLLSGTALTSTCNVRHFRQRSREMALHTDGKQCEYGVK